MRIKLSKSDWKRIGTKLEWLKTATYGRNASDIVHYIYSASEHTPEEVKEDIKISTNSISEVRARLSELQKQQLVELAALENLRSSLKASEGDAAAKAAAGGKAAAKALAKSLRLLEETTALVARCVETSAAMAETVNKGNAIWATLSLEQQKELHVPEVYTYGFDD